VKRLVPIVLALLLFATSARAGITIVGAPQGNASCSPPISSLATNSSSGVRTGDVIFAEASVGQSTTVSTPSGWTLIKGPITVFTNQYSYLFQRISDGTDGASYTFNFAGSMTSGCAYVDQITYRGVNISAPVDGSITNAVATSSPIVLPAVSPAGARDTLVAFVNNYSFVASTVSGMTSELLGPANVSVIYDQMLSASGSTGTRSGTASTMATADGFMFAVAPGPGSLSLWGDN